MVLAGLGLYWVLEMSVNWQNRQFQWLEGSAAGYLGGAWVNDAQFVRVAQYPPMERGQIAWGWQWLGLGPALVVVFVGLLKDIKKSEADAFYVQRNFYGTLKISRYSDLGGEVYRLLLNGHITHGFQYESVDLCNRIHPITPTAVAWSWPCDTRRRTTNAWAWWAWG